MVHKPGKILTQMGKRAVLSKASTILVAGSVTGLIVPPMMIKKKGDRVKRKERNVPAIECHKYRNAPAIECHKHRNVPAIECHKYRNVPAIECHKYRNAPAIECHKYRNVPAIECHKYRSVPAIECHKYRNVPAIECHKYRDAPAIECNKYRNAPAIECHKYRNVPAIECHKYRNAPAIECHKYRNPSKHQRRLNPTLKKTTHVLDVASNLVSLKTFGFSVTVVMNGSVQHVQRLVLKLYQPHCSYVLHVLLRLLDVCSYSQYCCVLMLIF